MKFHFIGAAAVCSATHITSTRSQATQQEQVNKMLQNNNETQLDASTDQGWAGVGPVLRASYDQSEEKPFFAAAILSALGGAATGIWLQKAVPADGRQPLANNKALC